MMLLNPKSGYRRGKFLAGMTAYALLLLFPSFAFADIIITEDTTWTDPSGVYVVTDTVRVQGALLTVPPGMIVKFRESSYRLIVEYGALNARQAIFTSYKDDAHGGDTNGDGNATSPAPGDWGAVQFEYLTDSTRTVINQTEFWYGGSGEGGAVIIRNDGTLVVESSLIRQSSSAGLRITGGPVVAARITNNTIELNMGPGIFSDDTGPVIIRNNEVTQNGAAGIQVSANTREINGNRILRNNVGLYIIGGGQPQAGGNQFGGNVNETVKIDGGVFPTGLNTTILVSTGSRDGVWIAEPFVGNGTWDSRVLPIILTAPVVVYPQATLTITAGTVVKGTRFAPPNDGKLIVYGTLRALGAAQDPVVFTSLRDDTYGGDANRWEGNIDPAAGDWDGVQLSGENSTIENAIFRYGPDSLLTIGEAGTTRVRSTLFSHPGYTGLVVESGTPLIENCTFRLSRIGVKVDGAAPTIANNTIELNTEVGILGEDYIGAATIRDNDIRQNGTVGIQAGAGVREISGNRIVRNGQGLYLRGGGRPIVSGNQFGGNINETMKMDGGVFPEGLNSTVLISTGSRDGIWIAEPYASSGTWNSTVLPFVLTGPLTVYPGATLTIAAGTVIKAANFVPPNDGKMVVYGSVRAMGTAQNPVVFTSLRDDSYGGDANRWEGNVSPAQGDWNGVHLQGEGSLIEETLFRYGPENLLYVGESATSTIRSSFFSNPGYTGLFVESGAPLIENCTFRGNRIGIKVNGAAPTIANNTIELNTEAGILGEDYIGPAIIRNNEIRQNSVVGVQVGGGVGEVSANRILGNGQGLYLRGGGRPNVSGNQFGGTINETIKMDGGVFPEGLSSTVLVSTGSRDGIWIAEPYVSSGTWNSRVLPFVLTAPVTVFPGATLTIEPGTIIKAANFVPPNDGKLVVYGTVRAVGSAQDPVVFTSLRDDSYGGDTNRWEGNVSPAQGDWNGVRLAGDSSTMEHVVLRYGPESLINAEEAGITTFRSIVFSNPGYKGLTIESGTPLVENCTFRANRVGLEIGVAAPTVQNNTFEMNTESGIWGDNANGGIIRNNEVLQNGTVGIRIGGPAQDVSGNRIVGNGEGLYLVGAGRPRVNGNQFGGNSNETIKIDGGVFPEELDTSVLLSTGGRDGIWISADRSYIEASGTWNCRLLPFVLSSPLTVLPGATLTIAAGTVVKLSRFLPPALDSSIGVNGTLQVLGTAQDPVIFTSLRDDTVGGDTNRWEGEVSPASGDWNGVSLSGQTSLIENARFFYGPDNLLYIDEAGTSIIRSSLFTHPGNYGIVLARGTPLIESCTFRSYSNAAIFLSSGAAPTILRNAIEQNGGAGILGYSDSGPAIIQNNEIRQNGAAGIQLGGEVREISGNRILQNLKGVVLNGMGRPLMNGNQFGENNETMRIDANVFPEGLSTSVLVSTGPRDGIWIDESAPNMTTSGTWDSRVLPIVFTAPLRVESGVTLTIAPGTVIKPTARSDWFDGRLVVNGTVRAMGTSKQPVVFTSLRDDTYGGDTNRWEGNVTPRQADWNGLFLQGQDSTIENAILRYGPESLLYIDEAGSSIVRSSFFSLPGFRGLIVNRGTPLIENCIFRSNRVAIEIRSTAAPTISSNTVETNTEAGILGDAGMGPGIIRNNEIRQNASVGIQAGGAVLEISGNRITQNGRGLSLLGTGRPIVSNNQFGANTQETIITDADTIPEGLSTNVLTQPGNRDGVWVRGNQTITSDGTWESRVLPFVLTGRVTVASNATLIIASGTVVKSTTRLTPNDGRLLVNGALRAIGTIENPVVFTSLRDDAHGGDSNRFEGNVNPAVGDWNGVHLQGQPSSLQHAILRYGPNNNNVGLLHIRSASATDIQKCVFENSGSGINIGANNALTSITDCRFQRNSAGIRAVSNATVVAHGSSFVGNDVGIHNDGTRVIQADFNWWGDPTGPNDPFDDRPAGGWFNPTGRGDRVSDRVNYTPWVRDPLGVSSPTVRIDEGPLVSTNVVHLTLLVVGQPTSMILAENPRFEGASFEPFSTRREWVLSPGDGIKTIYAQFRTSQGDGSEIARATTNLQMSSPTASLVLSPSAPLGLGIATVTLRASEQLAQIPSLVLTPLDQDPIPLALATTDFLSFQGAFTVTSETNEGLAQFSFSGVDLVGATGTAITSGATFYIDRTPPPPPSLNDPIALSSGIIRVSWTAPKGEPYLRYALYRSTEPLVSTSTINPILTELEAAQADDRPPLDGLYYYAVKGRDEARNTSDFSESRSTASDRTPPLPVTSLTAAYQPPSSFVNLSWEAPGGEPPHLYRVYRAEGSTPTATVDNLIVSTSSLAYVDSPSAAGRYYYGATTLDAALNESTITVTAQVDFDNSSTTLRGVRLTPQAPVSLGILTVVGQFSREMDTNVPLTVLLRPAGQDPIRVSSISYVSDTWSGGVSVTTSVAEGLAILSVSGGRDILGYDVAPATHAFVIDYTAPIPPRDFTVQAGPDGGTVQIGWIPSESSGTFSLYRSTDNFISSISTVSLGIQATSFIDSPVAISSQIAYAVKHKDLAGNESELSLSTAVPSPFTPFLQTPQDGERLTSLMVRFAGTGQLGTSIHIFTSADLFVGSGTVAADHTFAFIGQLPDAGENFLYGVARDLIAGQSPPTLLRRVAVSLPPVQVSTPTADVGDTTVTLRWNPNPEANVRGYQIYRDGSPAPLNFVLVLPSPSPVFVDIGLTNGRRYRYRVAAENTSGVVGPQSPPVEASPAAGPGWAGP